MTGLRPGRRPTASGRAFTLIELIAAAAVFLLMAVLIFAIVGMVSSTWQQGLSRIDPRKTGRAVLDQISRELESAVLPADRSARYSSSSLTAGPVGAGLGYQLLINPSWIGSAYRNPNAIFFQTPISKGVIAEVGYFVHWDESDPGNPRGILCRFFARPGEAAYRIDSVPLDWINNDLLAEVVKNSTDPDLGYLGHFADNVIGLWIRALDPTGTPIVRIMAGQKYNNPVYAYDSRLGYRYTPTGSAAAVLKSGLVASASDIHTKATLPPVIELAIVVLDPAAARRLTTRPAYPLSGGDPTAASFWADIDQFVASLPTPVRRGARVYSTRVALKNAD